MALTRRAGAGGYTLANSPGNATTLDVATPADTEEGDLLVLDCMTDDSGNTFAALTGWTAQQFVDESGQCAIGCWTKVASADDAAGGETYTVTWGGLARDMNAVMTAYDPDGDTPSVDDSASSSSSTGDTLQSGAVTVVAGGVHHVAFGHDSAVTVDTAPSGMSIIGSLITGGTTSTAMVAYDEAGLSAGDEQATIDWSASGDGMVSVSLALSAGSAAPAQSPVPIILQYML